MMFEVRWTGVVRTEYSGVVEAKDEEEAKEQASEWNFVEAPDSDDVMGEMNWEDVEVERI